MEWVWNGYGKNSKRKKYSKEKTKRTFFAIIWDEEIHTSNQCSVDGFIHTENKRNGGKQSLRLLLRLDFY